MAKAAVSTNYHPLVKDVARALRGRCKVEPGSTIVIGCSGGADSVALVRALAMLADRRKWGLRLVVGHIQHHLRGDEAERDAQFVSHLAGDLGLGFDRRDIHPEQHQGNLEAVSRRLRYKALSNIALGRAAKYVATAHHADDQLETVLMRLMRGAGVAGMRGIAWRKRLRTGDDTKRVYAIRPMMSAEHTDAIDLLKQLNQDWHEDATNADMTRMRARLRHQVIPLIKDIQADAPDKAVALGEHFQELHKLVEQQADKVAETLDTMTRDQARTMNPIVLTQMLRRDLINAGVGKDRIPGHALHPVVEAVRDDVGGERKFDFAGGVKIVVDKTDVRVERG